MAVSGAGGAGSSGAPAAGSGGVPGQPPASSFLYVGGYAPPITTFTLNHDTGALSPGRWLRVPRA